MFTCKRVSLVMLCLLWLFGSAAQAGPHFREVHYRGHHHSHSGFSFYLGNSWDPWDPWWEPWDTWYPRPYYYPPRIITVPVEPPVYIERPVQQAPQQLPEGYWYYCGNPKGYYPYVKKCPSGWQRVSPEPPDR